MQLGEVIGQVHVFSSSLWPLTAHEGNRNDLCNVILRIYYIIPTGGASGMSCTESD